jgi:hypothetical protein
MVEGKALQERYGISRLDSKWWEMCVSVFL